MKKWLPPLLAGLLLIGSEGSASAAVTFPNTSAFESAEQLVVIPGEELVFAVDPDDSSGQTLYDVSTGEKLQTLPSSSSYSFSVSDDRQLIANIPGQTVEIFDAFGDKVEAIESIERNGEAIENFTAATFLPDSHTLILLADEYGEGKLLAYDLDTKRVLFSRGTRQFGDILVSNQHIAVIGEKEAYIYRHDGTYETMIEPEPEPDTYYGRIYSADFSRDGLLVLGGEDKRLHVYDGQDGFSENQSASSFVTDSTEIITNLDIDESGQFIAAVYYDGFALFERATGRRIHTSLDDDNDVMRGAVALTKDARSILVTTVTDYGTLTSVYDGRNIKKRPVSISIPESLASVESGSPETLELLVTQADGAVTKVKSGVKWSTNTPARAYIKSGKLYGKGTGTYTLKASYEGFTASVSAKVTAPPKLSSVDDVTWLKRHKASILAKKTFEGAYAPLSSYRRVSGTSGSIGIAETDAVMYGKWKGSFLYAQYASYGNPNDDIEAIFLSPSLDKRTITKEEVLRGLGKPSKTQRFTKAAPYLLDKSKKRFAKYSIKEMASYRLNGYTLSVSYDAKGYARIIDLLPR